VLLFLVLFLSVGGFLLHSWVEKTNQETRQRTQENERAREELRKERYPALLGQAEQAALAQQFVLASNVLQECHPELRGWEWTYVKGLCEGRSAQVRFAHPGGVFGLASSPGRRPGEADPLADAGRHSVVSAGLQDARLGLWDPVNALEIRNLQLPPGQPTGLALSPDGNRLALAWYRKAVPEKLQLPGPSPTRGRTAEDGTHLVAAEQGAVPQVVPQVVPPAGFNEVTLWDLATGKQLQPLPRLAGTVTGLAFSPDGRYLAAVTGESPLVVPPVPVPAPGIEGPKEKKEKAKVQDSRWPLPRTQELAWAGRESVGYLALLAGANALAMPVDGAGKGERPPGPGRDPAPGAERSGRLYLLDVPTGKVIYTSPASVALSAVAFHPEGKVLAVAGSSGLIALRSVPDGNPVRELHGHHGVIHALVYDPSGARLASAGADGTVRLWDGDTGQEQLLLREVSGPVTHLAFHPNGQRLASAGQDRPVKIWDAASGKVLLALRRSGVRLPGPAMPAGPGSRAPEVPPPPGSRVTGLVFSSDGQVLLASSGDGGLELWGSSAPAQLPPVNPGVAPGEATGPPGPPPQ
jgi:WD40 repeat protein